MTLIGGGQGGTSDTVTLGQGGTSDTVTLGQRGPSDTVTLDHGGPVPGAAGHGGERKGVGEVT